MKVEIFILLVILASAQALKLEQHPPIHSLQATINSQHGLMNLSLLHRHQYVQPNINKHSSPSKSHHFLDFAPNNLTEYLHLHHQLLGSNITNSTTASNTTTTSTISSVNGTNITNNNTVTNTNTSTLGSTNTSTSTNSTNSTTLLTHSNLTTSSNTATPNISTVVNTTLPKTNTTTNNNTTTTTTTNSTNSFNAN